MILFLVEVLNTLQLLCTCNYKVNLLSISQFTNLQIYQFNNLTIFVLSFYFEVMLKHVLRNQYLRDEKRQPPSLYLIVEYSGICVWVFLPLNVSMLTSPSIPQHKLLLFEYATDFSICGLSEQHAQKYAPPFGFLPLYRANSSYFNFSVQSQSQLSHRRSVGISEQTLSDTTIVISRSTRKPFRYKLRCESC